jgi:hypothetical protein
MKSHPGSDTKTARIEVWISPWRGRSDHFGRAVSSAQTPALRLIPGPPVRRGTGRISDRLVIGPWLPVRPCGRAKSGYHSGTTNSVVH